MKNFNKPLRIAALTVPVLLLASCNQETSSCPPVPQEAGTSLEQVARLLAAAPLDLEQVREVHDAVTASADNGYDEEYPFRNLLETPGSGVGDDALRTRFPDTRTQAYSSPLRSLLANVADTRASRSGGGTPFLRELAESGLQLYWPYSEDWDGKTLPVLTFHPENGRDSNVGFMRVRQADGSWTVEEIRVDESVAARRPVWVVNRNEDAGRMTPRLHEKLNVGETAAGPVTRAGTLRSLTLKEFRSNRNFDSWFAGASEFYVKCGCIESFTASSEEELRRYHPTITDFMIVVRRRQVNKTISFNAMLVSDWTPQLQDSAFLIVEDDGGAHTSWKCSANVKIKSKVYGFDVDLPFRTNDDIVWRGRLSNRYFETYNNIMGHFGDVNITFRIAGI